MSEVLVLEARDVGAITEGLTNAISGTGPAILVRDSGAIRLTGAPEGLELTTAPQGTALLIQTSGSTGTPKTVALSAHALRASSQATLSRLGGPGQWLLALPLTYIAGLSVLVRSVIAGVEPVLMPSGPFDATTFLTAAQELRHDRRYSSLVPVQLSRLLDEVERSEVSAEIARRFDAILIGGQALEPGLRSRAERAGVNVLETYGSSETSGGCVYDGTPLEGVEVRIDESGEILLAGPQLATGYLQNEELNTEKFIEFGDLRWYRTGDGGSFDGQHLTVTGRLDRVIISGGLKISLDAVADAASTAAGIAQALAVNIPDSEWGERPGVVVTVDADVLLDAPDDDEGAPSAYARVYDAIVAQLGRAAAPKVVEVVQDIPLLESGKPDLVFARETCLQAQARGADNHTR